MLETHENPAMQSTKGDLIFLGEMPIHPMVAVFINLPIDKNTTQFLVDSEHAIEVFADPTKYQSRATTRPLPKGIAIRRLLLYLFSQFYQDGDFVLCEKVLSAKFLNLFGYNNRVCRRNHKLLVAYIRLLYTRFKFFNDEDNIAAGYERLDQRTCTEMLLGKNISDDVFEIRLNPKFMFKAAFPVDFRHVVASNRRCEFWNIYLLLVDVLPRIGHRKTERITWEMLSAIFGRSYKSKHAMANFKFNFKKQLAEVLEIYPQAKGKVEPTDSELRLKYTRPPI